MTGTRLTRTLSATDTSFVTVILGREKKRFVVHEAVLIHHSEYFRAALTGGFAEAQDKTVTIENTTVETFEFFVHWLYYQRLSDKEQHDDPELVNSFYYGQPRSAKLVKLYIFADARQVPQLREAVIDSIFARYLPSHEKGDGPETIKEFYHEGLPDHGAIIRLYIFADKYDCRDLRRAGINLLFAEVVPDHGTLTNSTDVDVAFQHLKPGDPLCRLLVDMTVAYDFAPESGGTQEEHENVAFSKAVFARYVKARQQGESLPTLKLRLCDYHEHTDDGERKLCESERGDADSDQNDGIDSD